MWSSWWHPWISSWNIEVKDWQSWWKDPRGDGANKMYRIEWGRRKFMDSAFCSSCNYISIDHEKKKSSRSATQKRRGLNLDDGEDRKHLGGPSREWRVPKSCSLVSHDPVAVWGRQWSYLQGDVVKKKKAGKSTRLCQTPKCSSFYSFDNQVYVAYIGYGFGKPSFGIELVGKP